jgi:hypothetical protein
VLRDLNAHINLGNDTNNQSERFQNIYGPDYVGVGPKINGNVLEFENRRPDTPGAKLLQVWFYYEGNLIPGKAFTLYVTPEQFASSDDYTLTVMLDETQLDLTATLTQDFITKTLGADPEGYYYLRNLTKRINIGNNTDAPFDFIKQNIYGPLDNNILVFDNRNYVEGDQLQIRFFNTLTDTIVSGKSFVPNLLV